MRKELKNVQIWRRIKSNSLLPSSAPGDRWQPIGWQPTRPRGVQVFFNLSSIKHLIKHQASKLKLNEIYLSFYLYRWRSNALYKPSLWQSLTGRSQISWPKKTSFNMIFNKIVREGFKKKALFVVFYYKGVLKRILHLVPSQNLFFLSFYWSLILVLFSPGFGPFRLLLKLS